MKFSVLNLILIVTSVAAIFGLYSVRRTNIELQATHQEAVAEHEESSSAMAKEIAAMRQELGYLTVEDRNRIYAVKLRNSKANTWSYRVFLPERRNYFFAAQINSLPTDGRLPSVQSPPGASTISTLRRQSIGIGCEPGEYVVTLTVEEKKVDWQFRFNIRESGQADNGRTGGFAIESVSGQWPKEANWIAEGGVSNQKDFSADEFVTLLDFRAMSLEMKSSAESDQGVLLWVGPAG